MAAICIAGATHFLTHGNCACQFLPFLEAHILCYNSDRKLKVGVLVHRNLYYTIQQSVRKCEMGDQNPNFFARASDFLLFECL